MMWGQYDKHTVKASIVALLEALKLSADDVRDIMDAFLRNGHPHV